MAKEEILALYPETEAVTKKLSHAQFGELIRALMSYRWRGEVYSGDDIAIDIAFQFFSNQVDRRDAAKASKVKAAKERWEKKTNAEGMQDNAELCTAMQTNAKGMQNNTPILSNPSPTPSPSPILSIESKADKPPAPPKPVRKSYGKYGWVKLTDDEFSRLLNDFGEVEVKRCIAYVDESAQSTGNKNKWRDWNLVIRKCHREGWGMKRPYAQMPQQGYTHGADRLSQMLNRGDFDD